MTFVRVQRCQDGLKTLSVESDDSWLVSSKKGVEVLFTMVQGKSYEKAFQKLGKQLDEVEATIAAGRTAPVGNVGGGSRRCRKRR